MVRMSRSKGGASSSIHGFAYAECPRQPSFLYRGEKSSLKGAGMGNPNPERGEARRERETVRRRRISPVFHETPFWGPQFGLLNHPI